MDLARLSLGAKSFQVSGFGKGIAQRGLGRFKLKIEKEQLEYHVEPIGD